MPHLEGGESGDLSDRQQQSSHQHHQHSPNADEYVQLVAGVVQKITEGVNLYKTSAYWLWPALLLLVLVGWGLQKGRKRIAHLRAATLLQQASKDDH